MSSFVQESVRRTKHLKLSFSKQLAELLSSVSNACCGQGVVLSFRVYCLTNQLYIIV